MMDAYRTGGRPIGFDMDDALRISDRIRQFWEAYKAVSGVVDQSFTLVQFGDTSDLANSLAALVVSGAKRASTSLASDHRDAGQPLPKSGDLSIIIDGRDAPRCIIRVVSVEVKRLGDVDSSFAWDEGEGDRSLDWWMTSHKRYFARQSGGEGATVNNNTEVVLERFVVVWPQYIADEPVGSKQKGITRT